MLTKRTLLAMSVGLVALPSMEAIADISQYNYSTNLTNKQMGVDIDAVIKCGSDYGTNSDCESSSGSSSQATGYSKNSNSTDAANDARSLNKGQSLDVPIPDSKKYGYSEIDSYSDTSYGKTRDISAQRQLLAETYGANSSGASQEDLKKMGINGIDQGNGVDHTKTTTGLTSTYNTNKIPNDQGNALRYKCLQPDPNRPANSTPADDDYYLYNDVQCLSIRTVSLANDNAASSGMTQSDPLRDFVKNATSTNNATNNKVINIDTPASSESVANQQSYYCGYEPERTEISSSRCVSKTIGRQQICNQKLTITCGADVTGDRDLPECVPGMEKGSIKLTNSSRNGANFTATDTSFSLSQSWHDGDGYSKSDYYVTFMVNNPEKVKMTLVSAHFDNQIIIYMNDMQVYADQTSGNATTYPNVDLSPKLRQGLNTFHAWLYNWHGPASISFSVSIDPSSYDSCSCKESWVKTCSIENVELQ